MPRGFYSRLMFVHQDCWIQEQILCKGGENIVVANKLASKTQMGLICF